MRTRSIVSLTLRQGVCVAPCNFVHLINTVCDNKHTHTQVSFVYSQFARDDDIRRLKVTYFFHIDQYEEMEKKSMHEYLRIYIYNVRRKEKEREREHARNKLKMRYSVRNTRERFYLETRAAN